MAETEKSLDESPEVFADADAPRVTVDGPSHVVGIGASAGGLLALEMLFDHMPSDTGMAFVVVQHLSPDFRSLMDELIAHHTLMPVRIAEDRMPVQPDTIHLIPPNKDMIVSQGRLLLSDRDRAAGVSMPIDVFFRSLAEDYGRRAVGIVLSGTGSDGSRGVRAIRTAGGFVLAQSEETAQFSGMPRSAAATGAVHRVAPPEQLPQILLELTRGRAPEPPPDFVDAEGDPLGRLFELLRERFGVDFSAYKSPTVLRRIERRLALGNLPDLGTYVRALEQDPDQRDVLFRDLLIGVTRFFRDLDAFGRLQREVVPELVAQMKLDNPIRIWVCGCASGEEAYSVAMMFHAAARERDVPLHLKLFATDVHRESLAKAAAGIYDSDSVSRMTPEQVATYFVRQGEDYVISPEIRRLVVFSHHDILKDAPFTRLHLISCRNLLIYLEQSSQKKILSLFHFALRKGGTLFLGPSETLGDLEEEFEPVDRHWRIYKKRREVRLGPPGLYAGLQVGDPAARQPGKLAVASYEPSAALDRALLRLYDQLLETFMPPSLIVSEHGDLVHTVGDAGKFLDQFRGRSTLQVAQMVTGDLRIAVSTALQRANRDAATINFEGVLAETRDGPRHIRVVVQPLRDRQSGATFYRISFEDRAVAPPAEIPGQAFDADARTRERIDYLEQELRHTKEHLQAAIEELETSNEELQSTNEELMASNEELQSTNEELHSVNEELYTVNAEYEEQIKKLTVLTDDMNNLLTSSLIGTIFVDEELRLRRFTPAVARLFRIVAHDIGRPFEDIKSKLVDDDIVKHMRHVLDTGEAIEREVRTTDGSWFQFRFTPYRTQAHTIAGVVLSAIDVSQSKATERAQAHDRKLLRALLDNSPTAITVHDSSGRRTLGNRRADELLGHVPEGQPERLTNLPFLRQAAAAHAAGGNAEFEGTLTDNQGRTRNYLAHRFLFATEEGGEPLVGSVITDITERATLEARLRENDRALETMLDHLTPQIAMVRPDGTIERVNQAWKRFAQENGYSGADLGLGTNYLEICTKGEVADPTCPVGTSDGIKSVMRGDSDLYTVEYPCDSPTARRWFRMIVTPYTFGERRGVVIAHFDLTDLREVTLQLRRFTAYLDLLLSAGRSGLLVTLGNDVTRLEFVSRNIEAWLGYPTNALSGSGPDWITLAYGEDRAALESALRDPVAHEVELPVLRMLDRHGDPVAGRLRLVAFDDGSGESSGARLGLWTPEPLPEPVKRKRGGAGSSADARAPAPARSAPKA